MGRGPLPGVQEYRYGRSLGIKVQIDHIDRPGYCTVQYSYCTVDRDPEP